MRETRFWKLIGLLDGEVDGPGLDDLTTAAERPSEQSQTELGAPTPSGTSLFGWLGTAQRDSASAADGLALIGSCLYDPATGRFLSRDPIPRGNDNPYVYPPDPVNGSGTSGKVMVSSGRWRVWGPDGWSWEILFSKSETAYIAGLSVTTVASYVGTRTRNAWIGALAAAASFVIIEWASWATHHGRCLRYSLRQTFSGMTFGWASTYVC